MLAKFINKMSKEADQNVLNLFHEWKSVDHSFEAIRVLLKNAKSQLKDSPETDTAIDSILEDKRIQGTELQLGKSVNIGDQFVSLYFAGDQVYPVDIHVPVKAKVFIDQRPFVLPLLFSGAAIDTYSVILTDHNIDVLKVGTKSLSSLNSFLAYKNIKDYLRQNAIAKKLVNTEEYKDFDVKKIGLSEESLDEKRKQIIKEVTQKLKSLDPEKNARLYVFASSKFIEHASRYFEDLNSEFQIKIIEHDMHSPDPKNLKQILKLIKDNPLEAPETKYRDVLNTMDPCVVLGLALENKVDRLDIHEQLLRHHLGQMNDLESLKALNKLIYDLDKRSVQMGVHSNKDLFMISSNSQLDMQKDRYFPVDNALSNACETLWRSYKDSLN